MIWIRNLIRKIRGKPPISNMVFNENDCMTTQEIFDKVSIGHYETILICVEHPKQKDDSTAAIKCFAKVSSDESILLDVVPDIISEMIEDYE